MPGLGKPASQDMGAVPGRYAVEQLDSRGEVVEALREGRFDAAVATWERHAQRHRSDGRGYGGQGMAGAGELA